MFYEAESEEHQSALKAGPQAFFKHVHLRIEDEGLRSEAVLPVGSWSLVREVTERALWEGRLEWIVCGSPLLVWKVPINLCFAAVGPYMDSKDTTTLAIMYNLFERVHGIKSLCNAFRMHLQVSSFSYTHKPPLCCV